MPSTLNGHVSSRLYRAAASQSHPTPVRGLLDEWLREALVLHEDWDALPAAAREEIRLHSGTQFDPQVVEIFLKMPDSIWEDLRREINSHARKYSYHSALAEAKSSSERR